MIFLHHLCDYFPLLSLLGLGRVFAPNEEALEQRLPVNLENLVLELCPQEGVVVEHHLLPMMDVREKPTLHHQPHNVRNLLVRRSNHSSLDLLLLALIPFNDNIHILMQSDVHDGCLLLFFI